MGPGPRRTMRVSALPAAWSRLFHVSLVTALIVRLRVRLPLEEYERVARFFTAPLR